MRNQMLLYGDPAARGEGSFIAGSHTSATHTHDFKLYVPPSGSGRARRLVVMLHGCTQNPDDFATGTGMNELGREQDFFVLYPAQSRGAGEPALLASMTRAVIALHGIDPRQVYIAGLSAGGAMAAIVAAAYPYIFAAVGVHSGLASGAAGGVGEALMVMRSGMREAARAGIATPPTGLPTIVFHGDAKGYVFRRQGTRCVAGNAPILPGAPDGPRALTIAM